MKRSNAWRLCNLDKRKTRMNKKQLKYMNSFCSWWFRREGHVLWRLQRICQAIDNRRYDLVTVAIKEDKDGRRFGTSVVQSSANL